MPSSKAAKKAVRDTGRAQATSGKAGDGKRVGVAVKKPRKPTVAPPTFSRAELVGKFPHIQHLSAPRAKRLLSNEKRKQLLALMLLV